jgi:hypothetical protein
MRTRALLVALMICGCGEESGITDGGAPDGGPDAQPFGACAPLGVGESPRDPGACCKADTDCAGGFCVGGWCSRTCTSDNDCSPHGSIGTPTAFPATTQMHCIAEPNIGVQGYCWPGSGQACSSDGGACPMGESCGVWFSATAATPDMGLARRCIANYATPRQAQTGERCDIEDPYQCANPVGLYHNCLGGACTKGCDLADSSSCPSNTECFGPLAIELRSSGTIYEGAGLCMGPECGSLQFSNPPQGSDVQFVQAPTFCGAGRYCAQFSSPKAGHFDTLYMLCATSDPNPMRAPPGSPCQQDPKLEVHCREELTCLQVPPTPDPAGMPCASSLDCTDSAEPICVTPDAQYAGNGAIGTCSQAPAQGFCSEVCRDDDDCLGLPGAPFGTNPPPICLETQFGVIANGANARVPYCFDHLQAFGQNQPISCHSESTCGMNQPHISCVPVSDRSEQAFCSSGLPGDVAGPPCDTGNATCGTGNSSVCLRGSDNQLHCTDVSQTLFEGAPCTMATSCASGNCWDRRVRSVSNSAMTARCSAVCKQSVTGRSIGSDCVAGMNCVPLLLHDNGTIGDSSDDTVMGFCITQTPETTAEQCTADINCTTAGHGDKCDMATKACYLSSARIGDACTNDADCGDGDTCLHAPAFPRFTGGYCVRYGCDPSTSRIDNGGCPAEAICVPQGGGTGTCERSCSQPTDCRSGYTCLSIGNNQSICNPV